MNRSERARLSILESVLERHTEAEKRAIYELRNAGIQVMSITEARKIQQQYREQARLAAHAVERMSQIARGRTK